MSLSILTIILIIASHSHPVRATETTYLNNVNNDFTVDGYTNVWYNTSTDQRDISVKFDSSVLRIITGVRTHYRTARLLADYDDCPTTYKFESGVDWVDYDDNFPNTTGIDQVHEFHCQGDTFLITDSFFYISMGCGSDDPFIQVGVDTDRSGYSEYSLNGGAWTLDTVEYLVEALVEDVEGLVENEDKTGEITYGDDFIDAYNLSLVANDDVHFNLKSDDQDEYFNMRFFPGNTKLTSDGNAIWLEEGATSEKTYHYIPSSSQEFIILVEPNTDGVDNSTYAINWTYAPDAPIANALPATDDDGNVSLSWNAPVDTDLDYYNVYRSNFPDVPIDASHRITTPGTLDSTKYNDTYLANGTYYYIITSVDLTGHESLASNEISTIVGDLIKPKAPILEEPDSFPLDIDVKILINWTFENPNDVISCNIYRSTQPGFQLGESTFLTNILKSKTSYEDQVILSGKYYYKVTSIDINGLESNKSNEVNTTYEDITSPQEPRNLETDIEGENDVVLSWDSSSDIDISYYKIYRSDESINQEDLEDLKTIHETTKNSWTDDDLEEGKYYYVIVSVDVNGFESDASECISIKISKENVETAIHLELIFLILIPIIIALACCALIMIHKKKHGEWFWKDDNLKKRISNIKKKFGSLRQDISGKKKVFSNVRDNMFKDFFLSLKLKLFGGPDGELFASTIVLSAPLTLLTVKSFVTVI